MNCSSIVGMNCSSNVTHALSEDYAEGRGTTWPERAGFFLIDDFLWWCSSILRRRHRSQRYHFLQTENSLTQGERQKGSKQPCNHQPIFDKAECGAECAGLAMQYIKISSLMVCSLTDSRCFIIGPTVIRSMQRMLAMCNFDLQSLASNKGLM